jgi:hypothetical protein
VAEQWRRGRGSLDSGENRGGTQQCAARVASMSPSGGPGRVGWLGAQAGSGARRRLLGDGRGRLCSGAQAARPRLLVRA